MNVDHKREKNNRWKTTEGRKRLGQWREGRRGNREATIFHWRIKNYPEGHPRGRKDDQREALTVG